MSQFGYEGANWFYEVIPELEDLLKTIFKDPNIRQPFTEKFNLAVNRHFENSRNGKGMTQGQLQAINLFFDKHVPGLDICTTCFKVSLPIRGAGERWTHRANNKYEVILSAARPQARFASQRVEYVTHVELDQNGEAIYATWNAEEKTAGFDRKLKQEATHISWDVYDFNTFKKSVPLCNCLKMNL